MTIALLFDLDGTIADSKPVAVEAFRDAFAECGGRGPAPVAQFLDMSGLPFEQIAQRLGLPNGTAAAFRRRSQAGAHRVRTFTGMTQVIEQAEASGAGVGVITGKDRPRTEHLLGLLGLGRLRQDLVTPSDPVAPKPAPDGVWWLCRRLGAEPADALLIGDSANDMIAGRRAGVATIGCLWGAGRPDRLLAAGAQRLVATPAELGAALGEFVAGRRGNAAAMRDAAGERR